MTPEKCNKIIAQYMGYENIQHEYDEFTGKFLTFVIIEDSVLGAVTKCLLYSKSLDALVPVWEKLRINKAEVLRGIDCWFFNIDNRHYYSDCAAPTIQEAAAIATAKAIQELSK